jgi:hypothetical protein
MTKKKPDSSSNKVSQHSSDKSVDKGKKHPSINSQNRLFFKQFPTRKLSHDEPKLWHHEDDEKLEQELEEKQKKEEKLVRPSRRAK